MVKINPLISFTEPVTRQDLQDMWSTGSLGGVGEDDLVDGFLPIATGSSFSDAPTSPDPGQLYWHGSENVMYVWHDEIEDTGVSLWLAIGPDKFETACLTRKACMPGEPVWLVGPDRTVEPYVPGGPDDTIFVPPIIGWNQSHINEPPRYPLDGGPLTNFSDANGAYWVGETAVTDEWIRVGIDGIVWAGVVGTASAPSENFSFWSGNPLVGLCTVPGLPSGLQEINDITSPLMQAVAKPTARLQRESAGGAPTEPWFVTKVVPTGKMLSQGKFNS